MNARRPTALLVTVVLWSAVGQGCWAEYTHTYVVKPALPNVGSEADAMAGMLAARLGYRHVGSGELLPPRSEDGDAGVSVRVEAGSHEYRIVLTARKETQKLAEVRAAVEDVLRGDGRAWTHEQSSGVEFSDVFKLSH